MKLTTLGLYSGHQVSKLQKIVIWLAKPFFYFFILCLTLLQMASVYGQDVGRQYSVTYVVTKQTLYQITDPLKEFSPVEKVQLRPVMVRDSVIKEVDLNNNIITSIYHLENSALEDWMKKPAKTVIDMASTTTYDMGGIVLSNSPHSPIYLDGIKNFIEYLNKTQSDIIPDYLPLTSDLKQGMADSGFVLTITEAGDYSFKKDSIEILFNDQKMVNEYKVFNTKGYLKYSKKSGFRIDENKEAVPSYVVETRTDDRFPQNCVRQVTYTDFPSYRIEHFKKLRSEESTSKDISIAPNPANESAVVTLPVALQDVVLTMTDNTGRVLMQNKYPGITTTIDLDVHLLEKGMYIITLHADDVQLTHSFIKN